MAYFYDLLLLGEQVTKTVTLFLISCVNEEKEFYIYDNSHQIADNKVFAIKHIRTNERHQPIIAEFNYYEPGLHVLGKPVYYLRIKTPIYRRGYKYDILIGFGKQKEVYAANPVLKICFDNYRKDEFKYFVCADLPLFYADNKQLNLSDKELIQIVYDLIAFADDLENVFTEKKDIKNESIIEDNLPKWQKQTSVLSSDRGNNAEHSWQTSNAYLYREKKYPDNFELINHMYALNMKEPFVKNYRNYGDDYRCVGFYKNDALQDEVRFYNYIYNNDNFKGK